MDSRKAPSSSSGRLPAFISQKGISFVKKQRERALSLRGKLPAPYKSRVFLWRFGSGSPLPLIIAYTGYRLSSNSNLIQVRVVQ